LSVSASSDWSGEHQFEVNWATIGLFGVLVCALNACAFFFFRLGLETPRLLVLGCVLVPAMALLSPLLIPRRGAFTKLSVRALCYPLVTFVMLASILLAFWFGRSLFFVYLPLALAGFIRAVMLGSRLGSKYWLRLILLSVAVSVYIFIGTNNLGYAGLYTPEQNMVGLLNNDTRFHTAIAYMIQNFGIASLGVDGVLPLNYHMGTHFWFAAMGLLCGSQPPWTYGAVVAIAAPLLLIISLILSAISIDGGRKPGNNYLLVGLLAIFVSDCLTDGRSYYISESYTFGLIGLLLSLPLISVLCKADKFTVGTTAKIILAILLIPVLMSLKISVGILWCVGFGWIVLRLYGFSLATVAIGVGCLTLLLCGLALFGPALADFPSKGASTLVPFYYIRIYPQAKSLSSFVFPLCLFLLAAFDAMASGTKIGKVLRQKRDLPLEAVIVVTVAAAIPPMIGIPQDSGTWYFLNVCQWYALPFLIARLSNQDLAALSQPVRTMRIGWPLAFLATFIVADQFVQIITPSPILRAGGEMLRAADRHVGEKLLEGRTAMKYFRDSFVAERTMFDSKFRAALAESPGAKVIAEVRNAINPQRIDAAVFIPPGNTTFWTFATCHDIHNVQVSLTGQPSLLGEPPQSSQCARGAYTTTYGERIDSREISDIDLCKRAASRRIQDVFVLNSVNDNKQNRILNCR
jgi:hypothetical protein